MCPAKLIEASKRAAARFCVDENIKRDCTLGVGSGSTIVYVLERVKELIDQHGYTILCVPTSFQAKQLISDQSLPLTDLTFTPTIDIAIDGADEVDDNCVVIKGGGGCLTQEKIVASAAREFYVVCDYRKNSKQLGDNWRKGIPIEVLPMAFVTVTHQICKQLKISSSDLELRTGNDKVGPVITDNGNFILDWHFHKSANYQNLNFCDWKSIANKLKLISGVLETGLFTDYVSKVYFGSEDAASVQTKSPNKQ